MTQVSLQPRSLPQTAHPRGTLLLVALYGVLFAASWFAVYIFLYLRRGGVTP